MANSGPNTNGSQFFLLVSDAAGQQLVQAVGGKASYSLYGQVTAGLDIVTKINNDGDASGTPKVLHKMVKVTVAAS
jgi:cyclophilin family peptidyl-prolyl cis-trans isomerase